MVAPSRAMAAAALPLLGQRLSSGVVVTPCGIDSSAIQGAVEVVEADHLIPTESNVRASARVADLARHA